MREKRTPRSLTPVPWGGIIGLGLLSAWNTGAISKAQDDKTLKPEGEDDEMNPARKQRLKEARVWYKEQNFTESSHIVKAYRQRFSVDNICAMRELVMLGLLPEEKKKMYKAQLAERDQKFREKKERRRARRAAQEAAENAFGILDQDENFYFIAGYTPGGAAYGITWEEAREQGLLDEDEE